MNPKVFMEEEFNNKYNYDGELGVKYSKCETLFRIWSPLSTKILLVRYGTNRYNNTPIEKIPLEKKKKGVWEKNIDGDLHGEYYNYEVWFGEEKNIATDPYAKGVGVNGKKGMVVNLEYTNPIGWINDKSPLINNVLELIIYEMHIRDFTISEDSGVDKNLRGKYDGVWEPATLVKGTKIKTGIDHLIELGINTVHILPAFDFSSIDESKPSEKKYNWGYDPENYNVPEGSYSLNPFDGEFRIIEFKQMIMRLHEVGIRVVMDVVYNHTYSSRESNLNKIFPDYYYRQWESGEFSNGSGCGNEIASERYMVRKLIVDSVIFWAKEYHVDGFRFDLMGLMDIDTIKEIRKEVDKIDENIIIYGEGWRGGASPLPDEKGVLKSNIKLLTGIQVAAFSDDIRDGIKGDVFNAKGHGFVNGQEGLEETIKFGVVASTFHPEIDYRKGRNSKAPWALEPYQNINYSSAHDNYTLWDKLQLVGEGEGEKELIKMNKLSAAIVLTSQGIPFLHAGEEFARSKRNEDGSFNENSYNASDSVNELIWSRKGVYLELFNYYKGLILLRKTHKSFRIGSNEEIRKNISFLKGGVKNIVGYIIDGKALGDDWNRIIVIFNGNKFDVEVEIPQGEWIVVVDESGAGIEERGRILGEKVKISGRSCNVLRN